MIVRIKIISNNKSKIVINVNNTINLDSNIKTLENIIILAIYNNSKIIHYQLTSLLKIMSIKLSRNSSKDLNKIRSKFVRNL